MSIRSKLFLTLLFCSAVLVVVPAVFSYISFNRGLNHYLGDRQQAWLTEIGAELEDYYRVNHSWEALAQRHFWLLPVFRQQLQAPLSPAPTTGMPPPSASEKPPKAGRSHSDQQPRPPSPRMVSKLGLLDSQQQLLAGKPAGKEARLIPLKVDQRTVGWLSYPSVAQLRGKHDRHFQQRLRDRLIAIGSFAILLAIIFAWLLARHLVAPITALSRSSRRLAEGDYAHRNLIKRHDELGQLAQDINQLASSLEEGRHARERWLADISHELRTPVAILQGEIQALVDGIRTPDSERLASLEQEIDHLHKLLNDLHDLALADSGSLRYRMQPLDLAQLATQTLQAFSQRLQARRITLETQGLEEPQPLSGDITRLRQLLHNLLDNSIKYTHAGGHIKLRLARRQQLLVLTLADSAPGVDADQLPHLFERLYRVDASRNRRRGGSGLGLAICQQIVHAHGGHLAVTAAALGGIAITVTLPTTANAASHLPENKSDGL